MIIMKKLLLSTLILTSLLVYPLNNIEAKVTKYQDIKPTALCKDGTYSYSQNRRGTCSYHKGVKVWYKTLK